MKKNSIIRIMLTIIMVFQFICCSELQAYYPYKESPNVLWVSAEDITTMLGCYGDVNANTPNLDAFAEKSILFSNAFATAPVCSPSRSCIVTGYYATTLGTQHLRSEVKIPDVIKPFPKYLREQGYYATNNYKEDYNFTDDSIWDDSSKNAHWKNRKNNQPFFSIFNLMLTHQSSIFGNDSVYEARISEFLPFVKKIDPESLILPSYYPDSPEIRKLWARYYTNVGIIDYQFGQIIKELENEGLSENTIVIFFSDHGTGMPRSKRALYDSGLKIPLLIHVPPKIAKKFNIKRGSVDDRMISFIDFAPTMLEIAGIEKPKNWSGRAIISKGKSENTPYVFSTSDRVDESFEMSRTIRTKKFRYIRNFLPHIPLLQPNFYTDQSRTMQELENFRNSGNLNREQSTMFVEKRMPEELYEIANDKDETHNLAYDPNYRKIIMEMRERLKEKIEQSYDTGLMPEPEMIRLSAHSTPYEVAHNQDILPIDQILEVSNLMLDSDPIDERVLKGLRHSNGFVRYWTLITVQVKGTENSEIIAEMRNMLDDSFATVQVEAAKSLVNLNDYNALPTILKHINSVDLSTALYASRAFQQISGSLTEIPDSILEKYEQLKKDTNGGNLNSNYYKLYAYWALHETLKI